MHQSIDARLMVITYSSSPGALTTRKRRVSGSVTATSPPSCAADQRSSEEHAEEPDGEVDDARAHRRSPRRSGTAPCTAGLRRPPPDPAAPRCRASARRSSTGRNSSASSGRVPRAGFEDAAAHEPPLAAGQVLQHQQRQTAERQPDAEPEADEQRRQNCAGWRAAPMPPTTRPITAAIMPCRCRRSMPVVIDGGQETGVFAAVRHGCATAWLAGRRGTGRPVRSSAGRPAADVVDRRVLAQLQRADVGRDRPAVRRRDLHA